MMPPIMLVAGGKERGECPAGWYGGSGSAQENVKSDRRNRIGSRRRAMVEEDFLVVSLAAEEDHQAAKPDGTAL